MDTKPYALALALFPALVSGTGDSFAKPPANTTTIIPQQPDSGRTYRGFVLSKTIQPQLCYIWDGTTLLWHITSPYKVEMTDKGDHYFIVFTNQWNYYQLIEGKIGTVSSKPPTRADSSTDAKAMRFLESEKKPESEPKSLENSGIEEILTFNNRTYSLSPPKGYYMNLFGDVFGFEKCK